MQLVAVAGVASSVEVVEVNAILDRENETAKLAVELVGSDFGARCALLRWTAEEWSWVTKKCS